MKESIFFRSLELCLNSAGTLQIFRNFFEALERTNELRTLFRLHLDFSKIYLQNKTIAASNVQHLEEKEEEEEEEEIA